MTQPINSTPNAINNYSWSEAFNQSKVTPESLGIELPAPPLSVNSLEQARALADCQRKIFVRRISAYAASKIVFEKYCGMPVPKAGEIRYEEILDQTNDLSPKEFSAHARERFYALVDKAPLSIFTKIFARIIFPFFIAEIGHNVDTISKNVLADFRGSIDHEMKADKFEAMTNYHLKNVDAYLKELCDIYAELKNSSTTGNIDDEIKAQLQKRLEVSEEKLQAAFENQCLTDYPVAYSATDIVRRYLKQFRFSKQSPFHFLNPVLAVVHTIIYAALWLLIRAPQKLLTYLLPEKVLMHFLPYYLLNRGVQYAFEYFLPTLELIQTMKGSIHDAIVDPTFAHTLNMNLEALLRGLCYTVQNGSPLPPGTVKLDNVGPMIQRLFTLLDLSGAKNIEDLKTMSTNPESPFNMLEEGWRGKINGLILSGAVDNIPAALEANVTPLQLEKLVISGLGSLNRLFDTPAVVTDEDIAKAKVKILEVKDKYIQLVTGEILRNVGLSYAGNLGGYLANVNLVQDAAVKVAQQTVKQRTDALIDSFLLKPHHYIQGLFDRLVLLPYLKAKPRALAPRS